MDNYKLKTQNIYPDAHSFQSWMNDMKWCVSSSKSDDFIVLCDEAENEESAWKVACETAVRIHVRSTIERFIGRDYDENLVFEITDEILHMIDTIDPIEVQK